MKTSLHAVALAALLMLLPIESFSGHFMEKNHDYLARFHNVIFLFDVSDSMLAGHPENYDTSRLFIGVRGLELFNRVMPHVPRWQYDLNTALITFGDCDTPKLLSPLGPWDRKKYWQFYNCMRKEGFFPKRTATLQDALQLAGSMIATASGRTAIVVITDGGSQGECPQKTATALKDSYGDKVQIFGIWLGAMEVGWRNLYEACKLTGGYARQWEEVRTKAQMKEFVWDITIREIMFPYPEIFFKAKRADLIPSEALKLESVANFLHAIPQYCLQIDGHTTFLGNTSDNHRLGHARAANVKDALIKIYGINPDRILLRTWGEELPRYDNQNPDVRLRNDQANLYLMLPLREFPYDEKKLHTFGVTAVGDIYNTQERDKDTEWAWPDKPAPGSKMPVQVRRLQRGVKR
ncbi:MAG: OmpA family protein [Desulfomonile tiedjei]|nr:OmpA family protein [Desulfomonile tiedjei]